MNRYNHQSPNENVNTYTPVNQHSHGKSHQFHGIYHEKWWFSWAMLVYKEGSSLLRWQGTRKTSCALATCEADAQAETTQLAVEGSTSRKRRSETPRLHRFGWGKPGCLWETWLFGGGEWGWFFWEACFFPNLEEFHAAFSHLQCGLHIFCLHLVQDL